MSAKISPLEDRISKRARIWSNQEIRNVAQYMEGHIVNVSAWIDDDKQGNKYRSYFPLAESYSLTNYPSKSNRSGEGIPLDLEAPLPEELKLSFDHVLNHTTLEHVFDFHAAFKNLCLLSRKSVTVIVPFSQIIHTAKDGTWLDYWRFTPYSVINLFNRNDFTCHYLSMNEEIGGASYILAVGVRNGVSLDRLANIPNQITLKNNLGLKGRLVNFALWSFDRFIKK